MKKVCIITGANSGLGFEVTKKLLKMNYTVIIGCKTSQKTEKAIKILEKFKQEDCKLIHIPINLNEFSSVKEFVTEFKALNLPLNLLINNAAIFCNNNNLLNNEGIELVLATNYYGQFLLTYLLMEFLNNTKGSRVVNVSSSLYKGANFDIPVTNLNPIDCRNVSRRSKGAYAFSKYLGILSSIKFNELHSDPTVTSVCPGFIPTTELGRDSSFFVNMLMNWIFPWFPFTSTLDEGVDRILEASHRHISELTRNESEDNGVWNHAKEEWEFLTLDQTKVNELWDHSLRILNLS